MRKINIVLLLVNFYALVSRLIFLAYQNNYIDLKLLFILYLVTITSTVAGYYVWNVVDIPDKEIRVYVFSIIFAVFVGVII
jgi:hypothetical protein